MYCLVYFSNWAMDNKQEVSFKQFSLLRHTLSLPQLVDIIETVYRGASKGRGLVVSPKGECQNTLFAFHRLRFLQIILLVTGTRGLFPTARGLAFCARFFNVFSRYSRVAQMPILQVNL